MSLIHINSANQNFNNPYLTSPYYYINGILPQKNPYYNAIYNINPVSVTYKKLFFKEFSFNYGILTMNESFNNNMTFFNVNTGLYVKYIFEPQNFLSIADFITFLNTNCPALNFVYHDPLTGNPQVDLELTGRITINAVDPTVSFQLFFDSKSIFRLLGFSFGTTPVIPVGGNISGVYNATLEPIGIIYLNIGLTSTNFSNLDVSFSFIVDVRGGDNGYVGIFNAKIKVLENMTFSQHIELKSTQFNQLKISLLDVYGNYVPLNSIYTLTMELLD